MDPLPPQRAREGQSDDSARALWQQRTRRKLTQEDLREIRQNAVGFFSLLQAWRVRAADADPERANSESSAENEDSAK